MRLVIFPQHRGSTVAINPEDVSSVRDDVGTTYNRAVISMKNGDRHYIDFMWSSEVLTRLGAL